MEEALQNRSNRLSKLSNLDKKSSRDRKSDSISLKNKSQIIKETKINKRKDEYKKMTKYDEIPDLQPRNFFEFLEKFPICKGIVEGKVGTPFLKHGLIDRILAFLKDQDITDYALKICLGEFEDGDLKTQLNELTEPQLKSIPIRIYKCLYEDDVKVSSTFKARGKHKKTHKKKRKRNQKKSQKGGYPRWFDDVPKGMSRKKYLRLKKSKPKNKSMKVWIKENKKNKRTLKRRVQKGGFAPCIPCLGPIFAGAGLSATGYMMSSSSSSSNINGKKSVKRNEKYQITKNGKTHKREFKQMNKRVYDGKKMSEYGNLKEANEAYNSLIKKCKSKGFQKC